MRRHAIKQDSLPARIAQPAGVHLAHIAHADDSDALSTLHVGSEALREYGVSVQVMAGGEEERKVMGPHAATGKFGAVNR